MVNWNMIGAIVLPNIGGWVGAIATASEVESTNGTAWYERIKKPSWNPPNWAFGVVWTVLYTAMGYASYMVYEDSGGLTDVSGKPLVLYGGQLILIWTWTPIFFKLHHFGLSLIHMFALDAAVVACTISFFKMNPRTLYFMAPSLCWLTFATCLTHSYWKLNTDYTKKH